MEWCTRYSSRRVCGEESINRIVIASRPLGSFRHINIEMDSFVFASLVLNKSFVGTGTCGTTDIGGDCTHGDRGAWRASDVGVTDIQGCIGLCQRCARCNYVSLSLSRNDDCSWYASCPGPLLIDGHAASYVTVAVGRHERGGLGSHKHRTPSGITRGKRGDEVADDRLPSLDDITKSYYSLPCAIAQHRGTGDVSSPQRHAQVKTCWTPNRRSFEVEAFDSPFSPEWIWPIQGDETSSGAMRGGDTLSMMTPFRTRNFALVGYCRYATMVRPGSIKCNRQIGPDEVWSPPPERHTPLTVCALAGSWVVWQHHVLNAAPMLGMSLPLLDAGYTNITVLHDGLLNDGANVELSQTLMRSFSSRSSRNAHACLARREWEGTRESVEHLVLAFPAPFDSYPPVAEDSYPRFSYAPFLRAHDNHDVHPSSNRRRHEADQRFIAFLSRSWPGESRGLRNYSSIATALRVAFKAEGAPPFVVIDDEMNIRPAYLSRAVAVIGVHGGAFSNIHACAAGTLVVEIVHRAGPRCYASLSAGLGLEYVAYFPKRMPHPDMRAFHYDDDDSSAVEVDPAHFIPFVIGAWRQYQSPHKSPYHRGAYAGKNRSNPA